MINVTVIGTVTAFSLKWDSRECMVNRDLFTGYIALSGNSWVKTNRLPRESPLASAQ